MPSVALSPPDPDQGEEQFERPIRKRHLMFCRQVAMGMVPYQAYRRYCAGRANTRTANLRTCTEQAYRFCQRWAGYIAALRDKLAKAIDQATIVSKVELLQWHSRAIRTPAELAASPDSDLATVIITETPEGRIIKTQGPSKADSAAALAKLAGFDAPQQIEVNHTVDVSPAWVKLQQLRSQARLNATDLRLEQGLTLDGLVESINSQGDSPAPAPLSIALAPEEPEE